MCSNSVWMHAGDAWGYSRVMSVPNGVGAGTGMPVAAAWHCENIGPRQRRKRILTGTVLLAIGVVVAASLVVTHADRWERLLVFPAFLAAGITLFQVRARTCVVFAARKVKNMDDGEVPVTDERELRELTRQARMVYIQGFALGALLTLVVLALP